MHLLTWSFVSEASRTKHLPVRAQLVFQVFVDCVGGTKTNLDFYDFPCSF